LNAMVDWIDRTPVLLARTICK